MRERRRIAAIGAVAGLIASVAAFPGVGLAATSSFAAVADTFVSATAPSRAFGNAAKLDVDADPLKQSFIRFVVSGTNGAPISTARLRLFQVDSSGVGGRVWGVRSNAWAESMTWKRRPAIDGPRLGTFGAVTSGSWYEVDVTQFVTGDGSYSFAIDTTSSNGSDWASRESAQPPALIVQTGSVPTPTPTPTATPTPTPTATPAPSVTPSPTSSPSPTPTGTVPPSPDGLTQVVGTTAGSSNPTYFNSQHRLAQSGDRLLTAYGAHATGVGVAWKDPGAPWRTDSTGASATGLVHDNGVSGDRAASIAVSPDGSGRAWVVWGGPNSGGNLNVGMRGLSDVNSATGPTIGSEQVVDAPTFTAYKPDIAFERAPDGSWRGYVMWTRRATDINYELVVASFTDLNSDTPLLGDRTVLLSSSSSSRFGTFVPTPAGMRIVTRGNSSALKVFTHDASAPPNQWSSGASGAAIGSVTPAAARVGSDGGVVAAVESDTAADTVIVQRFGAAGAPAPVELTLTGYEEPSLASDGTNLFLVMVRTDGVVVSRTYTPGSGWSDDRVEIGPEGGGGYEWPNVLRETDGNLRFIVRGPMASTSRSSVLSFSRSL